MWNGNGRIGQILLFSAWGSKIMHGSAEVFFLVSYSHIPLCKIMKYMSYDLYRHRGVWSIFFTFLSFFSLSVRIWGLHCWLVVVDFPGLLDVAHFIYRSESMKICSYLTLILYHNSLTAHTSISLPTHPRNSNPNIKLQPQTSPPPAPKTPLQSPSAPLHP
jgi:hypothetical protein